MIINRKLLNIQDHFNMGNYEKGRKHGQRLLVNAVFMLLKQVINGVFYSKNILHEKSFTVFITELKTRDFGKKL